MIKITDTEVVGWEHAIRGMRNPLNSWNKSDSDWNFDCIEDPDNFYTYKTKDEYEVGPNDLGLMKRLRKAGTDHRKFMRMIVVYVDILAPLYWWKEFDTYKVGTVANSCSTMHKIHAKEFTLDDFSHEHLNTDLMDDNGFIPYKDMLDIAWLSIPANYQTAKSGLQLVIQLLNFYRQRYLETKDKKYWWQMIQLLPSSYNQKRTVMLNYETLYRIHESRTGHKLDEWNIMCKWIESLPYSELLTERRTDGAVETH